MIFSNKNEEHNKNNRNVVSKQLITYLIFSLSFILQGQTIEKFSIDSGGASATAGGIEILYTIGEVNVQELNAGGISVSEGFINASFKLKIDPKIFLQGPFFNPTTAGLMNDDLRTASLLPTTSPYSDNASVNASVFSVTGNDAIVDWVWVELRAANDNTKLINAKSAFLQRDGDIVGLDGVSNLVMNASPTNYFVVVQHRNHLGVITAATLGLNETIATIVDLKSNSTNVLGGLNAVVNMGGIYAIYGGDYDENGQIQLTDVNSVVFLLGNSGYSNADIDLNGQTQNTELNNIINPNIGKGEQF